MGSTCQLCKLSLPKNPVDESFCCHGCAAVYRILEAQQALEGFSDHPVYQQALASGLISNQELIEKGEDLPVRKISFEVGELWCPSCARFIEMILLKKRGVTGCVVDYATDLATVEYAPQALSQEGIFEQVRKLGYTADPLEEGRPSQSRLHLRFGISAVCAANIMMFAIPQYTESHPVLRLLSFVFALPLFYAAWPLLRRGMRLGMEMLVSIGVISAFLLSLVGDHLYLDSMSMVVTLVLLGKVIENRAKRSVKQTLYWLARSLPRKGRKRFADGSQTVSVKEFAAGDELLVAAGERIVLDGTVIFGEGTCDESVMTGEARPVFKKEGDMALAGSLLRQGSLVIRVEGERSLIQQIVTTIQGDLRRAGEERSPVDRITRIFVPSVVVIAILVGLHGGLLPFLSVLLIACPCALGIAVPLAESLLIQSLSKMGALVRNRRCLQFLGRETLYAFDKTGTLTDGKFQVGGLETLSPKQRSLIKGLAEHSRHPISIALAEAISEPAADLQVEEIPGHGLRSGDLLLGSARFCNALEEGTYFSQNGTLYPLKLGDQIRLEALPLLEALKPAVILSGDIQKRLETFPCKGFGNLDPLAKRQWILDRPDEIVAFIGDGINDGPALTAAHIGISVLSASDLSAQASDVLLTTDLSILPRIFEQGRRGRRILRQNLFWAFSYNTLGIAFAAAGLLHPIIAATAMTLSSLFVLFNSMRLHTDVSNI